MTSLRKEAMGRQCQIRIPGVCNRRDDTVVLCHLGGAGLALKQPDQIGAWGCSNCHDAVDGRVRAPYSDDTIKLMFLEGIIRTQIILISEGKM